MFWHKNCLWQSWSVWGTEVLLRFLALLDTTKNTAFNIIVCYFGAKLNIHCAQVQYVCTLFNAWQYNSIVVLNHWTPDFPLLSSQYAKLHFEPAVSFIFEKPRNLQPARFFSVRINSSWYMSHFSWEYIIHTNSHHCSVCARSVTWVRCAKCGRLTPAARPFISTAERRDVETRWGRGASLCVSRTQWELMAVQCIGQWWGLMWWHIMDGLWKHPLFFTALLFTFVRPSVRVWFSAAARHTA